MYYWYSYIDRLIMPTFLGKCSQTSIKRSPLGQINGGLLKQVQFIWKFIITGKEKGDVLIQVTAWAGLTVYCFWSVCSS